VRVYIYHQHLALQHLLTVERVAACVRAYGRGGGAQLIPDLCGTAAQAAHANAAAANANSSPNPPNGLGSPQVSGAPAGASAVPKESQ